MRTPLRQKTGGLATLLCLSALLLQPASARAAVWYTGEFSADIIITDPGAPDNKVRGTFYVGKDRFRAEGNHQGKQKALIVHPQERKVWMLFPEEKSFYAGPGGAPVPPKPDIDRLPGDADAPCKQDKAIVCTRLGTETLNGIETEKWEVKITPPAPPPGQPAVPEQMAQKVTVWADPVRHIVIRQQPEVGPSTERVLTATEKVADRVTEKWAISLTLPDGQGGKTQKFVRWVDSKLRVPVREETEGKVAMELVNIQEKAQPASLFEVPKDYREISAPPAPGGVGREPPNAAEMPPPAAPAQPAQPGKLNYH
ncbi:MAG: DUF4412 domain-containing protein [Magnetococcales bacterium]|nr:DUF4412 domain-containing protein [Magnetococcales bacterium]